MMRLSLVILLVSVAMLSMGRNVNSVTDTKQINFIGKGVLCFRDTANTADISTIFNKEYQDNFKPLDKDINTFPHLNGALWFKFGITNNTGENIFLEVGEPSVNDIELYKVTSSGFSVAKHTGYFLPYRQREVHTNKYVLSLDLPRDSSAIYYMRIRMDYKETITLPLAVGNMVAFLERNHRYDLLEGIFYGSLILVVLFNWVMYFSSRDRSYLYFSLHAALGALWVANYYGNAFEFLWPTTPGLNKFTPAITAASSIFVILFSRQFLRTKEYAPVLHKGLYLLLAAFAGAILLNLFENYFSSVMIVEIAAFLMCLYLTIIGIYVYFRGFRPAKIYLLALIAFFSGIIVFLMQINGWLPANVFTRNAIPLGLGLEIGLISFAMGNRIRFYRLEKKKTQTELIASYEENERLLINLREQELKFMSDAMEVQENERKRIAIDLHDRLGSMLSTVKIYFNSTEEQMGTMPDHNKEQHKKGNLLLDEACEEVRRISHNLVSGELVKFGLLSAIKQMVKTIEDAGALKVNLLAFGMQNRPDATVEVMLHHIIQELMNNILKHSKATEVILQLNRTGNNLNIVVEDNGIGFNVEQSALKNGMGLKNIAARVNKLNGKLNIDTGKGKGTTTIIDIPVE